MACFIEVITVGYLGESQIKYYICLCNIVLLDGNCDKCNLIK